MQNLAAKKHAQKAEIEATEQKMNRKLKRDTREVTVEGSP